MQGLITVEHVSLHENVIVSELQLIEQLSQGKFHKLSSNHKIREKYSPSKKPATCQIPTIASYMSI